jgi:hypothetical protein
MIKVQSNVSFTHIFGVCLLVFLLVFSACTSSSSPAAGGTSAADAQAAARDALNRMDGGEGTPQSGGGGQGTSQGSGSGSPPVVNVSTGSKPAWVDAVDSVFSRALYVAAVGHASTREVAERNAIANVTAFFGQSIQQDQRIRDSYESTVRSGAAANWTTSTDIRNTITISVGMDNLQGTDIREVWHDTKNNMFYAAAVMEKSKAAQIYTDTINANQSMITNLITMTPAERNTIEGFARYQFAGTVADVNTSYANLLKLIDFAPPDGLRTGESYRLEATNIAREIPISVVLLSGRELDTTGQIQDAFRKALSENGFRTAASGTPYLLEINFSLVEEPSTTTNIFVRYNISANFVETRSRHGLLPVYSVSSREGHLDLQRAQTRAINAAVTKVTSEYTELLREMLTTMLSGAARR